MIDALATAPQTASGFAEASHKTIAFKAVFGEFDVFRQSILRSGSESYTDRSLLFSLLFIGNRVSIFHRRSNIITIHVQMERNLGNAIDSCCPVQLARVLGIDLPPFYKKEW